MSGPSDTRPFSMNISGFMLLGITAFILPTLLNIFNIGLPSWLFKAGIVFIVIGVIDTAFLRWWIV